VTLAFIIAGFWSVEMRTTDQILRLRSVDQWNLNSFYFLKNNLFKRMTKRAYAREGERKREWISTDPLTNLAGAHP
jgi:hypothetical protein